MKYRSFGKSNLLLSEISLGGEWFNRLSAEQTSSIIKVAIDSGMNLLDVFMPQPETRSNIGFSLRGLRDKMIIQGHLCTVFEGGQYERTRDIVKVRESFNDLLTRLKTDYIDIGMIHYVDSDDDYDSVFNTEIIEYAKELKKSGTIHHIGLSSHNPRIALRAVESGLIDVLMFSINPAYDMEKSETDIYDLMDFKGMEEDGWTVDSARQALYTACAAAGVAITVMKSLGAGTLLSGDTSPFGVALTSQQCIHYCLNRVGVTSVIVGCDCPSQVMEAASYYAKTNAELDYSHIFSGGNNIKMTGRCMYCNHCNPCSVGIDIGGVTKFLDLATIRAEVPESVSHHYLSLEKKGGDCVECGQCEPNCPFGVKIIRNMRRAKEVFGS